MKKRNILLLFALLGSAGVFSETVATSAGNLATDAAAYLSTVTNLTITGTINARDVKTMRDQMPLLEVLDLSGSSIVAYDGTDGPMPAWTSYPANEMPASSFLDQSTSLGKMTLKTITLPIALTSIGNNAFMKCAGLTGSLILPSGITNIGHFAFGECAGLSGVLTLPTGLKSLGAYAFAASTSFTGNLTLPGGLTTIGSGAFYCCYGITSVVVSEGITSLEDDIFEECSITSLTLPNGLTNIGAKAFYNCMFLKTIYINNPTPPTLGDNCFNGATMVTDVFVPSLDAVETYQTDADWGTYFPGTILKTKSTAVAKTLACTAGNLAVQAAAYLSTVTNLTITGTIDARDVKTMRDEMPLLEVLDLSGSSIANYYGNDGTMPDYGIYSANKLPQWSFCDSQNGVGKESLKAIILPTGLINIGEYAFFGCFNLTGLNFPSGLLIIDQLAFFNCYGITSVSLPANLIALSSSAFGLCTSLTEFIIPDTNTAYSSLNGVLYNKNKTTLLQYPNGKSGAFSIPNSVTSIGEKAFATNVNLSSITFPQGLTGIGDFAFYNCTGITSIYAQNSVPPTLGISCFENSDLPLAVTDVYVPTDAAVTNYKADATGWYAYFPGDIIKKYTATGISKLGNGKVNVYAIESSIIVDGTQVGETVRVYSTNGVMLQAVQSAGGRLSFAVASQGVYFVKTANKTYKVIL